MCVTIVYVDSGEYTQVLMLVRGKHSMTELSLGRSLNIFGLLNVTFLWLCHGPLKFLA